MPMILQWWRTKVLIHVILTSAITMFVFVFIAESSHRADLSRLLEEKLDLLTHSLYQATEVAMIGRRVPEIQTMVESFARLPDIRKIRIISVDGRVMFSSDRGELEKEMGEGLERRVHRAEGSPDGRLVELTGNTLQQLQIIPNQPRCHGCHPPGRPVNGYLSVEIDVSANMEQHKVSSRRFLFLALVVTLVMTFIIHRLMDRLVRRPIDDLRQKIALAREGNFEHSVAVPKDDEIGSLAQGYNDLVIELKRAREQIEESHRRDLQRAEHLATIGELAAGLAHEIKNPLAGIKGALEVIESETRESRFRYIMAEVLQQIDRIDRTVNDLLSYARPRAPQRSPQDLNEIVESIVKFSENKIRGKEIVLDTEFGTLPDVNVDPEQIRQVLLNLILNAMQAIDTKGRILIRTAPTAENGVLLQVTDNGRGITSEHLKDIFRPFFTTKAKGTGLGLPISRGIIEKHGGQMTVESTPGEGTTFWIHLPSGSL